MMPKLYRAYTKALTSNHLANVLKGFEHRVELSLRDDFQADGSDKKWGPWANKNKDPIKIFWDFSEEERLAGLHNKTWGKQQEKDRREYELKHRIPTGNTPEHWRDESSMHPSDVRWPPSSAHSGSAAPD